jgi:hypothetical protein
MRTVRNVSSTGPLSTYRVIENGMRMSEGDAAVEAKFDGRDYPVAGEPKHTVSLNLPDENTIERTDKQDGKVTSTTRMTVSKDGKSIRVEFLNQQRGSGMNYTAEKRP